MAGYGRVVPRDLFNEAKLLKCLGFVCLLMEESSHFKFELKQSENGFKIRQDASSGDIRVANLHFWYLGTPIYFSSSLNSKGDLPLIASAGEEDVGVSVLVRTDVDKVEFSEEFVEWIKATFNDECDDEEYYDL